MDFSATKGPPGTRFIRKKVSVATMKTLRIPMAIRFRIYLLNRVTLLAYAGHTGYLPHNLDILL